MPISPKHRLTRPLWMATTISAALLAGCAVQTPPIVIKEPPQSTAAQKSAQLVVASIAPAKRKQPANTG